MRSIWYHIRYHVLLQGLPTTRGSLTDWHLSRRRFLASSINAAAVLATCDAAVARDSTEVDWREIRGVARALAGDVQGAIEDLVYVAEHHDDEDKIAERQRWVEVLRRGENPITEEVLTQLEQGDFFN